MRIHTGKKHKNVILNPTYDNFAAKKTSIGDCHQVFISESNKSIIFVHDMKCCSYYDLCEDLASLIPQDDHPVLDDSGGLHILNSFVLQDNMVDWEQIYRLIIGYSLENLDEANTVI